MMWRREYTAFCNLIRWAQALSGEKTGSDREIYIWVGCGTEVPDSLQEIVQGWLLC